MDVSEKEFSRDCQGKYSKVSVFSPRACDVVEEIKQGGSEWIIKEYETAWNGLLFHIPYFVLRSLQKTDSRRMSLFQRCFRAFLNKLWCCDKKNAGNLELQDFWRLRAGDERIELPPKVLETPIIPFDQSPMFCFCCNYTYKRHTCQGKYDRNY